jgi:type VI secretion system protein ImpM
MGTFGAFGKMPALGDFFRFGLGTEVVTPWDAWLQQMLLAARATLGETFEGLYMSAPVWRFALAPSVVGGQGVLGVLMPSVDRVGRQFPLTLAVQTGAQEQAPLRNLIWQADVLEALEGLALDCLDDSMTRDALQARLAELTLRPMGAPSSIGTFGSALVMSNTAPQTFCADLALDLAGGEMHRSCAWAADVGGAARLILTSGLPQADVAHFLFDLNDQSHAQALAGAG